MDDSLENRKCRFGFSRDTILSLIVERAGEAVQVEVESQY